MSWLQYPNLQKIHTSLFQDDIIELLKELAETGGNGVRHSKVFRIHGYVFRLRRAWDPRCARWPGQTYLLRSYPDEIFSRVHAKNCFIQSW